MVITVLMIIIMVFMNTQLYHNEKMFLEKIPENFNFEVLTRWPGSCVKGRAFTMKYLIIFFFAPYIRPSCTLRSTFYFIVLFFFSIIIILLLILRSLQSEDVMGAMPPWRSQSDHVILALQGCHADFATIIILLLSMLNTQLVYHRLVCFNLMKRGLN